MSDQQCTRCLYRVSHPLGLIINDEGLCSGCRVHEEKDWIDWRARKQDLAELVRPYRSLTGRSYDCIVPVSGAQDSFFTMHLVKNVLRMNPLAVTYNHQFNSKVGIRNLARLREVFDVPLRMLTVNPISVRRITRATMTHLGSVHWHAIAGQTAFPVQVATQLRVPLVIWGAHQGVEQVGMFSHLDSVEMNRRYRKEHDLMGLEADDLLVPYLDLRERDIWQLRYPGDDVLLDQGTRGIYLGNFMRWDPTQQHRDMVAKFGFRGARLPRTFDPYDHVDSLTYMGIHDWLKFLRHGYSKVTDHASREIRHGRLTRKRAERLVTHYETGMVPWLECFADWLGATLPGIMLAADRFSKERLMGRLFPRDVEDVHKSRGQLDLEWETDPSLQDHFEGEMGEAFTLIGRGFPY